MEPQYIRQRVWLQYLKGEIVGPRMVVDRAGSEHRANLHARGRLGDISWEFARRWGMTGPLDGVTLYLEPPIGPPEGKGEERSDGGTAVL